MKNLRDYVTLTKPRLNFLALLMTLAGFYMGSSPPLNWIKLVCALLGATGVAAGCGALNQWLEMEADRHMGRTQGRPLPSGRMPGRKAFVFGIVLSIFGLLVLFFAVNELTAFLGFAALVSYVALY